jgi:hypothetical protein
MFGINPSKVYAEDAAALALGVSRDALIHARRKGRIEYRRIGIRRRRVVYRGTWLIAWLDAHENGSPSTASPRPSA